MAALLKALSELERPRTWADVATIGAFLLALAVAITSIIPRTRMRLVALLRLLWSLPPRIPFRVVKRSTINEVRSEVKKLKARVAELQTRLEPQAPVADLPKPLSVQERVERVASFCEDELGKYDALDPGHQSGGYFRAAGRAVNEIVDELRGRVGIDYVLEQGVGRVGDPTRAEIERVARSLRRIEWKKPAPGRAVLRRP